MQDFFTNLELDEAKKLYHKLILEHHPDRGGDEETCKQITAQFREYLAKFTSSIFSKTENKEYADFAEEFREILDKIIHFENLKIQIIGHWIYCFDSYAYKDQLKELNFWFSSKHKAWVFSGTTKKRKIWTKYTMDEIRENYGCTDIKTKQREKISC